jgi:hypothetical protein
MRTDVLMMACWYYVSYCAFCCTSCDGASGGKNFVNYKNFGSSLICVGNCKEYF